METCKINKEYRDRSFSRDRINLEALRGFILAVNSVFEGNMVFRKEVTTYVVHARHRYGGSISGKIAAKSDRREIFIYFIL